MALTYETIASTTLSSAQSAITFTSISSAYTDLIMVCRLFATSNGDDPRFRCGNGSLDTGSNYYRTVLKGRNAVATSGRATTDHIAFLQSVGVQNNIPTYIVAHLFEYSNTSRLKSILFRADCIYSNGSDGETNAQSGTWNSTSAIDTVSIYCRDNTWKAGTMVTLYGVKAA